MLEDGQLTDDELRSAENLFSACVQELGYEVGDFVRGGGYTQRGAPEDFDPSNPGDAFLSCSATYESVSPLYWSVARNPSNANEQSIMAACLVKEGLAPDGYSAKDFRRDQESGRYPFSRGDPLYLRCAADPLDLAPDGPGAGIPGGAY